MYRSDASVKTDSQMLLRTLLGEALAAAASTSAPIVPQSMPPLTITSAGGHQMVGGSSVELSASLGGHMLPPPHFSSPQFTFFPPSDAASLQAAHLLNVALANDMLRFGASPSPSISGVAIPPRPLTTIVESMLTSTCSSPSIDGVSVNIPISIHHHNSCSHLTSPLDPPSRLSPRQPPHRRRPVVTA